MLAQAVSRERTLAHPIDGMVDESQSLGCWPVPSDKYQSIWQAGFPYSYPFTQGVTMKLLTDLFTTDYGIMSISGIIFMIGMAGYFAWYFNHKMNESQDKSTK
jgi:hypothetical protein